MIANVHTPCFLLKLEHANYIVWKKSGPHYLVAAQFGYYFSTIMLLIVETKLVNTFLIYITTPVGKGGSCKEKYSIVLLVNQEVLHFM